MSDYLVRVNAGHLHIAVRCMNGKCTEIASTLVALVQVVCSNIDKTTISPDVWDAFLSSLGVCLPLLTEFLPLTTDVYHY